MLQGENNFLRVSIAIHTICLIQVNIRTILHTKLSSIQFGRCATLCATRCATIRTMCVHIQMIIQLIIHIMGYIDTHMTKNVHKM